MARIEVMKKGEKKDEPQNESNGQLEKEAENEVYEEKEVPVEKMTKADLIQKYKEIEGLAEKNYDLYLRSQAEIDNLKKRFQKEKEGLVKYANESLIKQLLSVVDNLEQAICHSGENTSLEAIKEGVELTHKGLMDVLKKGGVEEIDALGKPFDPNFHEAVFEQEDPETESGTVLQEFQKGYLLNQRLISPTKVIVSKNSK